MDNWIEEFTYTSWHGEEDKSLRRYKDDINALVERSRCNDMNQCSSCPIEEHEGKFCNCEERNSRIAKKIKEKGERTWRKKNS